MLSEKEKPGLWGEIYAARFMRKNGYEIITANYRCRLGEIDIIAAKNGVLAFVEVKTRLFGSCGRGSESVTAAKRQKIRRCALCYISMCQRRFEAIDFQVVDINADHLEGLEI